LFRLLQAFPISCKEFFHNFDRYKKHVSVLIRI